MFEARAQLGDWAQRVRISPYEPLLTMEEKFSLGLSGALRDGRPVEEVIAARARSGAAVIGGAFVSMLLKGCLDRGASVLTETSARELVADDDGRIIGVRAETKGGSDANRRAARGGPGRGWL